MATPTYKSWSGMKYRCDTPTCEDYPNYGGRGITYDPRWKSYIEFRKDLGKRPEGYTLDRIDTNGNYTKANCRWSTSEEQNNNRRTRIRGVQRKDNTSSTPGVFYDKRRGTWYSRIYINGIAKMLCSGKTYDEAVAIREHYETEQNIAIQKGEL